MARKACTRGEEEERKRVCGWGRKKRKRRGEELGEQRRREH